MTNAKRAAIAIGRNEGDRLKRCLESLHGHFDPIVYVDSGSTDDSVEFARSLGLEVAELDMSQPFSAGRARNAGFDRVCELDPETDYVLFIDGDCELDDAFADAGERALASNRQLAIVNGRRRERAPDATIFNRLCDFEWDSPVGEARACGGDFMARRTAFAEVGGFDHEFVGGEEPELCLRLRDRGWKIERLDAEMTLHDADIHRVGQWWRRAQRTGHAYTATAWKHDATHDDPQIIRPVRSMLMWSAAIPLGALLGSVFVSGWSGALLLLYPVQILSVSRGKRTRGRPIGEALAYGLSVVAGKFAQFHGMLRFLSNRMRRRAPTLIEYKGPDQPAR